MQCEGKWKARLVAKVSSAEGRLDEIDRRELRELEGEDGVIQDQQDRVNMRRTKRDVCTDGGRPCQWQQARRGRLGSCGRGFKRVHECATVADDVQANLADPREWIIGNVEEVMERSAGDWIGRRLMAWLREIGLEFVDIIVKSDNEPVWIKDDRFEEQRDRRENTHCDLRKDGGED